MQNNQNNNSDKSQYVDNATFVNQVLKENPNIKKATLQMGISRLKQELFNGKAEKDFNQQDKQIFSEKRQELADKYKKKAIISLERKEGKYVSNADFLKNVCTENPNVNSEALRKAISRLKKRCFNGKSEYSVDPKERQKFSKERQKLADKYTEQEYVSNADFLKKVCTENPNVNSVALQKAISRLKERCFNGKSEYSVDPKERQKFSKERQKLADEYKKKAIISLERKEGKYMSNADFLKKVCTENPNINKSHMLMFKRKRNKKEKSSGQPTNEEVIKEIIGEYNLKPLKYTSKKGKGTTMSRPDAIEWFLKKHPLQEDKQQTTQQINNNINLEEENNDLMQVGCKNMNKDNYEAGKYSHNDEEDLEEKSDDFSQVIKKHIGTDDYEAGKKCYNDVEDLEEKSDDSSQAVKKNMEKMYGPEMSENNYNDEEDLEEKSDDFSQAVKRNMEKMNGSEMSENNFKYINNNSSSTKKISNNLENNLK